LEHFKKKQMMITRLYTPNFLQQYICRTVSDNVEALPPAQYIYTLKVMHFIVMVAGFPAEGSDKMDLGP
jgi:hypothetical protein